MTAVQRLNLDERVHIDGGFLGEVIAQLGPMRGAELIRDALGSMALDLEALLDSLQAAASPDMGEMVGLADRLSRLAWEVGLTTLSGVALDMAHCAERGDINALHAVGARLQRVGDQSLSEAMAETELM